MQVKTRQLFRSIRFKARAIGGDQTLSFGMAVTTADATNPGSLRNPVLLPSIDIPKASATVPASDDSFVWVCGLINCKTRSQHDRMNLRLQQVLI
jgi:hypothetical protein